MKNSIYLSLLIFSFACQKGVDMQATKRTPTPLAGGITVNGWAAMNGGTIGGKNGSYIYVNTAAAFISAAQASTPAIIVVSGTNLPIGYVLVGSDKTIIGDNASVVGTLRIQGTNVIIKNLTISNPGVAGTGDGISIAGGKNVFITHCTIYDCSDGEIDITKGADFVTVEWCKFYYNQQTAHSFVNLVGADNLDPDQGKLNTTFHHNYYWKNCDARMPRIRFGRVHVYNNVMDSYTNHEVSAYIEACIGSQVLIENNTFLSGEDAWARREDGKLKAVGNTFGLNWFDGVPTGGNDVVFTPPYSYTIDSVSTLSNVIATAGVNGDTTTVVVADTIPAPPPPPVAGDVTSFIMWDAERDIVIRPIEENEVFDISDCGTIKFNAQSIIVPGFLSVKYVLSGPMSYTGNDDLADFFLFKNDGASIFYGLWKNPVVGNYTLTATPYTGIKATGTAGVSKTIHFSFKL
jgi:pectate lyase